MSLTELTATVPAGLIASGGAYSITVFNPAPDGGSSEPETLTVSNVPPTILSISPTSAVVGDPDTTITVHGTGYVSDTAVHLGTTSLVTTFVSTTELTAVIPTTSLASAGSVSITAVNPPPGNGTSSPETFTVNNAVPTITFMSPDDVEAGGPSFMLEVNGTGYSTSSVINVDSVPLATTYINPRHLEATISSAKIVAPGTLSITVTTPAPGGGTSAPASITVSDTTPPNITITAPTKISQTTITDTTIHVTNISILAANVSVDASSTAGTSNLACTQTSATVVDCDH